MVVDEKIVKSPKISIIITYYNLGKYIQDCISSILNQTYDNFEIIIVNDRSDYENTEILNYINNEKITKINLKKNSGQLVAFFEGLKIAKGEFICMIDADDVLLPNYLKALLFVHLNNKTALVSSNYGEINQENEITLFENNKKNKYKYSELNNIFDENYEFKVKENKLPYALWGWNPASSAMFRKASLDILKYYPDMKYWKTGADKVVFSLLHLVGGSMNIGAILYLYRHHNENNSQTSLTTGKKKYLGENYVKKLIKWNIKLRTDTIKMFLNNKEELISKFNKLNYHKMLFRVIFCVNIKVCIKIIKTLMHKISV